MKKVLALIMALALVFSLGSFAYADHTGTHGTSTAASVIDGSAGNQQTEFYMNITADSTLNPEIELQELGVGANGQTYIIDYKDKSKANTSVTVPLYVCMYASSTTGGVVTPTNYSIDNSSTYTVDTQVTSIKEYFKVYDTIAHCVFAESSEYYSMTDTAFKEAYGSAAATMKTAAGQTYAAIAVLAPNSAGYYVNADGYIAQVSGTVETLSDGNKYILTNTWTESNKNTTTPVTATIDGVEYSNLVVGSAFKTAQNETGLPIIVTKVEATTTDWTLVSNTTPANAKELYMAINGLDLSEAVGGYDTSNATAWRIDAPTGGSGSFAANEKTLTVAAAIAANQNSTGEAQVVSVKFSIASALALD